MSPTGFEPAILENEWPQAHTLDRAATGFGTCVHHDDGHMYQPKTRRNNSYILF